MAVKVMIVIVMMRIIIKRQQLFEAFANSYYKINLPILLQTLINDFAVCKHCSRILLLDKDVTSSHGFGD